MLRLTLCHKAQYGNDHIAALIQRVELLGLKVHAHRRVELSQHENVVQTVQHISGKTADLLRDDKVDLSRFAFLDHFEKVLTVQNRSAGNALIGENTGKLPFRILPNHTGIVLHLKLVTACLGVLIRADTAVRTHTKFFLFGFRFHIPFCRNDLYLLLRTINVCVTDDVLGRLPFILAATARSKWLFLRYLHRFTSSCRRLCGQISPHRSSEPANSIIS